MAVSTDEKISVDEQFLRDYVNRGLKAQIVGSEQEIDKENVDAFLREQVAQEKASNVKTKLQMRAEKQGAANEERVIREKQTEEQKRAAQQEAQRKKEEDARLSQSQKLKRAAGNAATQVGSSVQPALDRVAQLHTVGGIGLLLLVLAILIFTIVQVNAAGDTRLKQLWAMLNGNATLIGRVQVDNGQGQLGNPGTGQIGNTTPMPVSNGTFRSLPPLLGV